MREGVKPEPVDLYFDKEDFRLYPIHPFLHLLPATGPDLIREAERRYGWKERHCRYYISSLRGLPGIESEQGRANQPKLFRSTLSLLAIWTALQDRVAEAEQGWGLQAQVRPPELSAEQGEELLPCTKVPPLEEPLQDADRIGE
jgi:hypothetical protein